MDVDLILYSKPGCHLCEGLAEKLTQVTPPPRVEVRDITTDEAWWAAYQYEIPVLCVRQGDREIPLPRFSPRGSVSQLAQWLERHCPG